VGILFKVTVSASASGINDPGIRRTFYDTTADWHFTLGDGPVDH
jgi:hypothetical protein